MLKWLCFVPTLVVASVAFAQRPQQERLPRGTNITGKVVRVVDGDTLAILESGNRERRIRLHGIDAPESKQAFGSRSKESLSGLCFGKTARVEVTDTDRYGRTVGRVFVGETNVNLEQVRVGMAWRYVRYDKAGEFTAAEAEARSARRGLWVDKDPTPPWEWRKLKRQAKSAR